MSKRGQSEKILNARTPPQTPKKIFVFHCEKINKNNNFRTSKDWLSIERIPPTAKHP